MGLATSPNGLVFGQFTDPEDTLICGRRCLDQVRISTQSLTATTAEHPRAIRRYAPCDAILGCGGLLPTVWVGKLSQQVHTE